MKIILSILTIIILPACSQHTVYDMIHERERQECLKQGRTDCPRAENYDKYKRQRDESLSR